MVILWASNQVIQSGCMFVFVFVGLKFGTTGIEIRFVFILDSNSSFICALVIFPLPE